ncbi:hypothetical protein E2320_015558 [Naja naja]|nr:hypothetical protein E2320_015558 [Naja naja]
MWTSYINRFECVMDAVNLSDIPSNRKKAYFLSFCGATIFNTAAALVAPQMVKAVTWEDLQEVLGNHYAPKPSRIVCRHAFRRRSQAEGKSIGVRDLWLQRRLLAKADLDLKQAIEEAQAAELSNVSAAAIQKASSLPWGKPSSAVHYEDTFFKDEDFEVEEEINHLRAPQPTQRRSLPIDRRQPTQQLICLSCGGKLSESHMPFQECSLPQVPEEKPPSQNLSVTKKLKPAFSTVKPAKKFQIQRGMLCH